MKREGDHDSRWVGVGGLMDVGEERERERKGKKKKKSEKGDGSLSPPLFVAESWSPIPFFSEGVSER